ncbi:MAG: SCP2 sterol-binding domain-containing protein [Steroidobacteraceae bacterium]
MLTEQIQAMIDRHVAGSPRARQLLTELAGRRLQIVGRYTPWRISLRSLDGQLLLSRQDPVEPDAVIAGSPLGLLALLREDPADVIRRGDVSLSGDAELAARFQELLQLLRPDLEAGIARVTGDIPAHGAGLLLRKALEYGRASLRTQATNVGEYLAHEKRVLVPRAEAEQYLHDVDALREQADRLAARVALLESRQSKA